MKMIDVVINEKICYNIYTMCKWWEKNGNKRITRKYWNEQKGILRVFRNSLQNRNRMGKRNKKNARLCF